MIYKINPNVNNKIVGSDGSLYNSIREFCKIKNADRKSTSRKFKRDGYVQKGNVFYQINNGEPLSCDCVTTTNNGVNAATPIDVSENKEYQDFLKSKEVKTLPFEKYEFKFKFKNSGYRYGVALFSDAHIEETVLPNSVLGLNEYNIKIAKSRIENYFVNLVNCINEDKLNSLIFASLGDSISGYIHDELSQCNELTPLEATYEAQSLIYSGLNYICNNTNLENIKFVGIVGNHSRTTKKIQHANGYKLSYEWLMYKNIEAECAKANLPIDFYLPESEMAIVDTSDEKRFIFIHGFQIRSGGTGTVCGIYPALNRLSMKWDKTFKQDKIYLGHFHSCISMPNATVNGSIIGYNSFALTNGFSYEEPAQMYEVYDNKIGMLLNRKIYCV